MLLKNYNNYVRDFFFNFISKNNTFLIMNINDYDKFNFYSYCFNFLKVFHNKSFLNFNVSLNLFSGNNYFCFVEQLYFYYYYIEFLTNDNSFDLLGVCLNNYFFNINFNFFNLSNKIFHNYFLIIYCYNIYCFFFFFKFLKFLVFRIKKC